MFQKIKDFFAKRKLNNQNKQSQPMKWTASRITALVVGILLCVIFVPLLAFNMTLIIKGAANPDKVPSIFNLSPMIVQSGSMEPEFYKGDLIFVKGVDYEELKVDDVIAFYEGDDVITHRIVAIETQGDSIAFRTKGDNSTSADLLPVEGENVVGLYVGRIGKLGDFAMFLQSPLGMVIFIGTPIILYILFVVIRREIYVKKNLNNAKETPNNLMSENQKLKEELERLKSQNKDDNKENK